MNPFFSTGLLNQNPSRPAGHQATTPGDECCGHVLIVEDEHDLALLLDYHLRNSGFTTSIAYNGADACRLIEARPDLVLLDLMLPDIDGWEICRRIRGHHDPLVAAMPVVMLTALGAFDQKLAGLAIGADLYLPKPYSMREVLLTAERLAKRHRRMERLHARLGLLQKRLDLHSTIGQLMAHELKNSSCQIGGFASLLEKRLGRGDNNGVKTEAFLTAISKNARYLEDISHDLPQAMLLIEQGEELARETVHLASLFEEMQLRFTGIAARRPLDLKVSQLAPDLKVATNLLALRIILVNLLDNAIKYSKPHTTVRLVALQVGDNLVLTVEDQGPGIPEDEQRSVVNRFQRGRASASHKSGTGLGLYLAQTLAAAIGSDLALTSAPGQGCCFDLVISLTMGKNALLTES